MAATLYESMLGNKPYDGSTPFALFQAWQTDHRKLTEIFPQLPVAASEVVDRALAAEPSKRFNSCHELASAFAEGLKSSSSDGSAIMAELDTKGESSSDSKDGTRELDLGSYRENTSNAQLEIENLGNNLFPDARATTSTETPPFAEGELPKPVMFFVVVSLLLTTLLWVALTFDGLLTANSLEKEITNSIDMRFQSIPAGDFIMRSPFVG